jgi:hypothetical protein
MSVLRFLGSSDPDAEKAERKARAVGVLVMAGVVVRDAIGRSQGAAMGDSVWLGHLDAIAELLKR